MLGNPGHEVVCRGRRTQSTIGVRSDVHALKGWGERGRTQQLLAGGLMLASCAALRPVDLLPREGVYQMTFSIRDGGTDRPQSFSVLRDGTRAVMIFMREGHEAPPLCADKVGAAPCARILRSDHLARVLDAKGVGVAFFESDELAIPAELVPGSS